MKLIFMILDYVKNVERENVQRTCECNYTYKTKLYN